MTEWELWCFYVGEVVCLVGPLVLAAMFGHHVATKFGSWKKFWIDLTTEKEDYK